MKIAEHRIGEPWVKEIECPGCTVAVAAWISSGMSGNFPHFYCDQCSNVYLCEAAREYLTGGEAGPKVLAKIARELPACPCGGRFTPGENPKCPNCNYAFEHQHDALQRLSDPQMIVVHKSSVYGDRIEPFRVLIVR